MAKEKLQIVKVGGNIIENQDDLNSFLDAFAKIPHPKILIHGGGKEASKLADQLGIEVKMMQGRRLTDASTLEVITMVYAGKVNKSIIAQLQARSCNAVGFSGADGNSILSVKRPVREVDYGYVGDVIQVNTHILNLLLMNTITPVFCALTHDGNGQLLNTNADTIACELARALSKDFEVVLNYCFEKAGVLRDIEDENSVIKEINTVAYKKLIEQGTIVDGMLPKLHNCFYALEGGVSQVRLGKPEMLDKRVTNFTTLKR